MVSTGRALSGTALPTIATSSNIGPASRSGHPHCNGLINECHEAA